MFKFNYLICLATGCCFAFSHEYIRHAFHSNHQIYEHQFNTPVAQINNHRFMLDLQSRQSVRRRDYSVVANEQNYGLTWLKLFTQRQMKAHVSYDVRFERYKNQSQFFDQGHAYLSQKGQLWATGLNFYYPRVHQYAEYSMNTQGELVERVRRAVPGYDMTLSVDPLGSNNIWLSGQLKQFFKYKQRAPLLTGVVGIQAGLSNQVSIEAAFKPSHGAQSLVLSYRFNQVPRKYDNVSRDIDIVVDEKHHVYGSLKDESIVIGNAPIKDKVGDIVDSFGTVYRINGFATKAHEEYFGSKMNVWVTNDKFFYNILHDISITENDMQKIINQALAYEINKVIVSVHDTRLKKMDEINKQQKIDALSHQVSKLIKGVGAVRGEDTVTSFLIKASELDRSILKKYSKFQKIPPTTGFHIIAELLKTHPHIYIHGFNNFKQGYHYYDPEMKFSFMANHSNDDERRLIKDWVKQGRIRFIGSQQYHVYQN